MASDAIPIVFACLTHVYKREKPITLLPVFLDVHPQGLEPWTH